MIGKYIKVDKREFEHKYILLEVRFTNEEVIDNVEKVMEKILQLKPLTHDELRYNMKFKCRNKLTQLENEFRLLCSNF